MDNNLFQELESNLKEAVKAVAKTGVDKVEFLKKHGPFRQYNRAIQFDAKTGKMIIADSLKAKLKSKPAK